MGVNFQNLINIHYVAAKSVIYANNELIGHVFFFSILDTVDTQFSKAYFFFFCLCSQAYNLDWEDPRYIGSGVSHNDISMNSSEGSKSTHITKLAVGNR